MMPTVAIPAATTPTTVQVDLSGLPADSTLHYRLVATSDGGTTEATDATLKTAPQPEPAPPAQPAPPRSPGSSPPSCAS